MRSRVRSTAHYAVAADSRNGVSRRLISRRSSSRLMDSCTSEAQIDSAHSHTGAKRGSPDSQTPAAVMPTIRTVEHTSEGIVLPSPENTQLHLTTDAIANTSTGRAARRTRAVRYE